MLPFRSVGKAPGQGSVEEAHEELRGRMLGRGFVVVEEGEEEGWDDWVDLRAKEGAGWLLGVGGAFGGGGKGRLGGFSLVRVRVVEKGEGMSSGLIVQRY